MPTVARVDMVFSLMARDNYTDTKGGKYPGHLLGIVIFRRGVLIGEV